MKISIETKVIMTFGLLVVIMLVASVCTNKITDDELAIQKTKPSVLENGVVENVLTNYEGIRLVKIGHNNKGFARFAFAVDPSISNGTRVKLIEMSCYDSTTSMHANAFQFHCRIAVRIDSK